MMTTSEIAIVAVVWALTSIGLFFGLRGLLRRIQQRRTGKDRKTSQRDATNRSA